MPAIDAIQALVGRSPGPAGPADVVRVVCAWPVSGQYGPGSRVLYYVLVAACVFARKVEWLRKACLAAALLFPAVAALHGLVLASVHVNGAIDLDVFGAFQLCAIGILAAPLTIRLSRTYFFDPGRNIIFLWTALLLAGLLSLAIEFYRVTPIPCTSTLGPDGGDPVSKDRHRFPYGEDTTCGLTCSVKAGPFTPARGGASNNIYVIPTPNVFTFDAAFYVACACCLPAILWLIFTMLQILEINSANRAESTLEQRLDEPMAGTNGATNRQMNYVNTVIRAFLSVPEALIFGGAVLVILVVGEINLFSTQVRYQTEPMANIGQWAPIAGTALAVVGSLYLRLAGEMKAVEQEQGEEEKDDNFQTLPIEPDSLAMREGPSIEVDGEALRPFATRRSTVAGHRRMVATALLAVGDKLGTAAHKKLDVTPFKGGKARDFPTTPGEHLVNPDIRKVESSYNPRRDSSGNVTPRLGPAWSRSPSFTSLASRPSFEPGPSSPRLRDSTSPRISGEGSHRLGDLTSPGPAAGGLSRPRNSTSPGPSGRGSSRTRGSSSPGPSSRVSPNPNGSGSPGPAGESSPRPGVQKRRSTLDVPKQAYGRPG